MKQNIFILIIFSSCFKFLFSTYYPSTVDYNIEILFGLRTLNSGDIVGIDENSGTVYGLFWATGGIDIQGSSGYVVFASPLSVDTQLALNDQTYLVLEKDLVLSDAVYLSRSGKIDCKNGAIVLNGNFLLEDNTLSFINNDAIIKGNDNVIDFSKGGSITIVDNKNFIIQNAYLKGIKKDSIVFSNRSCDLCLTNCILELGGDFCVDNDLFIFGDVLITGTYSFCVNRYLIVSDGARLTFDLGTTFSMGYPASVFANDVNNKAGTLHFNGCNIKIGDNYGQSSYVNNGFYLHKGNIIFENKVYIDDDSNNKTFQLTGSVATRFLAGARVILEGTTTFSFGAV